MDDVYDKILNMTNKEAAAIIRKTLETRAVGRANGKTTMVATWTRALMKAIEVLENTPDEKEKDDVLEEDKT